MSDERLFTWEWVGETISITKDGAFTPEATLELLRPGMQRAQEVITRNLLENLYADYTPAKPTPWYARTIRRARRWLGDKLTDLASWVAGYDVRGDW